MQKRVAIARAIATQPKYLFCDEPNSGLDPQTSIVIDQLIKEITHEYNITTVVNTHDMNSVMEIGENINYIHEGQLWWKGNSENVLCGLKKEVRGIRSVRVFGDSSTILKPLFLSYFLLGFLGNQPLRTRSFCSKSSFMLQSEENPNTPTMLLIRVFSIKSAPMAHPMPTRRKIHQGRVPK